MATQLLFRTIAEIKRVTHFGKPAVVPSATEIHLGCCLQSYTSSTQSTAVFSNTACHISNDAAATAIVILLRKVSELVSCTVLNQFVFGRRKIFADKVALL
jgi:hypothetical protein